MDGHGSAVGRRKHVEHRWRSRGGQCLGLLQGFGLGDGHKALAAGIVEFGLEHRTLLGIEASKHQHRLRWEEIGQVPEARRVQPCIESLDL